MSTYTDIFGGLRIPAQLPLDPKTYKSNQAELSNLGANNNLAFTYYKGLIVYCAQESTYWIWREKVGSEIGLITPDFVYPSGVISLGVNYSGQTYNFFPYTVNSNNVPGTLQILDSLEMSFDWKGRLEPNPKPVKNLPKKVSDSYFVRKGYIGYTKPVLDNTGEALEYPPYEGDQKLLFEAIVFNLGVKIKNFDFIKDFEPTVVISRYTPSVKKNDKNPKPINPEIPSSMLFPTKTWRRGSFKFSKDNDPIRLSRIPIKKGYQILDFGQEHYFRHHIKEDTFSPSPVKRIFSTRGANKRYSQVSSSRTERTFVYLQFHIEIKVQGETYLSKPLGRLKMVLQSQLEDKLYPFNFGDIVPYDFSGLPEKQRWTRIYFKHT
jgi:hypothetical protein